MNVRQFRDALQATLAPALGSYQLPNGSSTPACSVRNWGDGPPAGTTVTGLEAIIIREPATVPIRQYQDEQSLNEWSCYLVNWTGGNNSLQAAVGVILAAWPGTVASQIQVSQGVGPLAQVQLTIRDYVTVAAAFAAAAALLLEDGGYLLLEDGGKLLQE
jgi:hypothetical protein